MGDHYETLGVAPNATIGEIEQAFADIAEQYHPSKHEENELKDLAAAKLAAAQHAYTVLRDTRLRAQYDREAGFRPVQSPSSTRSALLEALKAQVPSLVIKGLWLLLTFVFVRLVKNPKIILFTFGVLILIWGVRRLKRR
ncbi:MAG: J domain-containing protein [Bradymonadia bacterium]